MTLRYERRCRTLLRAYPPRYRTTRGDELLGTLLDLAAPGRATPSVRQSWDIVRGGLTNRGRTRPSLHHWLGYRLVWTRLPYEYRWWARDDALGRWYRLRAKLSIFAVGLSLGCVGVIGKQLLAGDSLRFLPPTVSQWVLIVNWLVISVLPFPSSSRTNVLAKHEFFADGVPYEVAAMRTRAWGHHALPPDRSPLTVDEQRAETQPAGPPNGGADSFPWQPPQ
jgi:hypothetical protein